MNYIWAAALAADRSGIPRENLCFIPVRDGSPYTELVLENINQVELNDVRVEVNPLYRFSKEFSAILDINLQDYEKTRKAMFNTFMHYMVQLDLRQGLSRQEYALRFLLRDLLSGICGSQAIQVIENFDQTKLHRLLHLVYKLYQCGSSVYLFREVMRCQYPDSLSYVNNESVRQILIYVGMRETESERENLGFLVDMFLPVNYEVFVFWDGHFGIIGIDETMELDEMVLF